MFTRPLASQDSAPFLLELSLNGYLTWRRNFCLFISLCLSLSALLYYYVWKVLRIKDFQNMLHLVTDLRFLFCFVLFWFTSKKNFHLFVNSDYFTFFFFPLTWNLIIFYICQNFTLVASCHKVSLNPYFLFQMALVCKGKLQKLGCEMLKAKGIKVYLANANLFPLMGTEFPETQNGLLFPFFFFFLFLL